MANLPNFPEFDVHPRETTPMRFEKYLKRLRNLFVAMKITDPERKTAMFLHYAGEEINDIHDTLTIAQAAQGQEGGDPGPDLYKRTMDAFVDHFEPQKSTDHHVFVFRKERQRPGEATAEFYTRLQMLGKKCDFADVAVEIRRQIIQGTTNTRLRRKAMEGNLNLDQILKSAHSMETAEDRAAEMDSCIPEHSNAILRKPKYNPAGKNEQKEFKNVTYKEHKSQQCGLCGGKYPHKGTCPAQGKICFKCGTANHFAHMCRNTGKSRPRGGAQSRRRYRPGNRNKIRTLDCDSDSSEPREDSLRVSNGVDSVESGDEYLFHHSVNPVNNASRVSDKPVFNIDIAGTSVQIMADSGATVNILNEKDYQKIREKPKLLPSTTRVYPYMSSEPLKLCGKFQAQVSNNEHTSHETFYVTKGASSSLLSWKTSQKIHLLQVANSVKDPGTETDTVLCDFPDIVGGIGACKVEPVRVHVDTSVKPVAQPHRRVPFHVRKKVEEKLHELEAADIIERAEGPTPWISPIVVVPKPSNPDDVRVCVDMREVNRAILRERHVIPTVDDIVADLNGCTVFSKVDLKLGYHQVPLHPESRHLTTFSTHEGLWRYKRLNFGMSCSAEIFQKVIGDVIMGIPGTRNISDDIYVGGRTKEEHDERLRQVLRRLTDMNLRINPDKCQFRTESMLFFGHMFSGGGISPDPAKIEQIQAMKPPVNVTEVRSLLSSAAFVSRYIKDFATITRPLRKLTHKDQAWQWGQDEERAFTQLKQALSADTTLGYFDPNKETIIYTDGSPVGIGAVLTQKGNGDEAPIPLYYASYPLTATEARYPQIDREALSIYWAVKRFHLYVYGKDFKVVTDHKPLISLFNNPSSKPSTRIERWLMDLQRYRFTVEYQPGKNNPADYASRHPPEPVNGSCETNDNEGDMYVTYVVENAVPKAMNLPEIEFATGKDKVLQAVMDSLRTGNWHKRPDDVSASEMSRYESVKSELTCNATGTILLKANRIVVPTALQDRTIDIAHEGHLGIVKTKSLLREKVWFPLMDKMTEDKVKSCLSCQIATPVTSREPLQPTELPEKIFELVSIDFAYFQGETVLIVIDDYSRFPFVEPVKSTSASVVIPKLDELFSIFGTPETLKSDNGPPFNGEEFARFASVLGFKHRKVTPLWPRANGEVERFVRTVKKHVKIAKAEGTNWRKALQAFLRSYRNTPHCTTGIAPATLFLKRSVNTKLPQVPERDPVRDIVYGRDDAQKKKMKLYADAPRYVRPSDLEVGESVLVKTPFNLVKGGLPYQPTPLVITKRKGSMITASDGGRSITRNSSFFKRIQYPDTAPSYQDDTEMYHGDQIPVSAPARVSTPAQTSPSPMMRSSPAASPSPMMSSSPAASPSSRVKETACRGDNEHSVPRSTVASPQLTNIPLRRSTRVRKARERLDL